MLVSLLVNLFTVSDYQFQNTLVDTKGLFNIKHGLKSFAVSYKAYI
jgi:hypothetical protein